MAVYPHRVKINPTAVEDFGLAGYDGAFAISGYGINTFGFIWGIADIWRVIDDCQSVVWEDCACAEDCD